MRHMVIIWDDSWEGSEIQIFNHFYVNICWLGYRKNHHSYSNLKMFMEWLLSSKCCHSSRMMTLTVKWYKESSCSASETIQTSIELPRLVREKSPDSDLDPSNWHTLCAYQVTPTLFSTHDHITGRRRRLPKGRAGAKGEGVVCLLCWEEGLNCEWSCRWESSWRHVTPNSVEGTCNTWDCDFL